MRASTALRTTWAASLVIVVLIGVVGGTVLAAAAGARRTASAYERMLVSVNAADVLVNPDEGIATSLDLDAVRALPEVEDAGRVVGVFAVPPAADGSPSFDELGWLTVAAVDDRAFAHIERPNVLSGRTPDPSRADEVLINPTMAAERDLEPGDTLDLFTGSVEELFAAEDTGVLPELERIRVTVTGIGVGSDEIVDDEAWATSSIEFTPAFYQEHPDSAYFVGLLVRLEHGADDVAAFRAGVERLAGDEAIAYQTKAATMALTERAIRPSAVALAVFAAIAGLAGLVVVAHALSRQLATDRNDAPVLSALGLTHRQRWVGTMAGITMISVAGAALAGAVAVGLSPLTPVGVARLAEPAPGVAVDLPVLLVGCLAVAALLPLCVALPAWRAVDVSGSSAVVAIRSRLADALARLGAPPTQVVGVRLALEPGAGRTTVPARSTLVATALAVAATAAAVTFAAGLDRLVDTPSRYGWDWDLLITDESGEPTPADWAAAEQALVANEDVAAVARGTNSELTLGGRPVPAIGIESVHGWVGPTIVEGRHPSADDEVALGARTMDRLGVQIGDRVGATSSSGSPVELRIVGQAVFPGFGTYSGADNTELGTGALVTSGALDGLASEFDDKQFFVVDLRPGAGPVGPELLGERSDLIESGFFVVADRPLRPADVVYLGRVAATPIVLSILLALFAVAALTHALVTSTRFRRRDLAVLRVLGFGRGQVGRAVAWQATTVAIVALVIGLPLGVALGRWSWTLVADALAIPAIPVIPAAVLALGAVVAVVIANLAAALPAWSAGRVSAAASLRAE
jgi:hypothetical protein